MAQDLEARVKALEATVQELRDREAIRDLVTATMSMSTRENSPTLPPSSPRRES